MAYNQVINYEFRGVKRLEDIKERRYEQVKPFSYHGLVEEELFKVLTSGLSPGRGVYGPAIYTKTEAYRVLYEHYGHDAFIAVYGRRARDNAYILKNKRDWVLFDRDIKPTEIIYGAIIREGKDEVGEIKLLDNINGINIYEVEVNLQDVSERVFNYKMSELAIKEMRNRRMPNVPYRALIVERIK